jgi:hypothetical protein
MATYYQESSAAKDMNGEYDRSFPRNIDEAVDRLIAALSQEDKNIIAEEEEDELRFLSATVLGVYIQKELGLGSSNSALMASCCSIAGVKELHFFDASTIIIEKLWKRLIEAKALPSHN